ncbi:28615_t:CDS:2 [Gigaspora margarita]|uniref:28615_t:CDS:1 n=1 Tax=Gigaspora margarita TaxID=4874 RepID=A0ABN7UHT3_GIGMA|nr:28615_t:CDS:2 [Gigaspora margarita]
MAEDNEESLLPLVQLSISSILVKTYGDIYFNTQNTEYNFRGNKQKWACTSKTACGHATTIRTGTWLARSKLSFAQIDKIIFCWSHKLPQKFAVLETGVTPKIIVNWYNFCLKASLSQYGTSKTLYNTYFAEYIWRQRFIQNDSDAFNKLIEHIVIYHKNLEEIDQPDE